MKMIKGLYGDMVPEEVYKVQEDDLVASIHGFTTRAAAERKMAAVNKYPEYFPWETTYLSIPLEVHDAFYEEAYPDMFAYFKTKDVEESKPTYGKGLLQEIQDNYDRTPKYTLEPLKSVEEFMSAIQDIQKKEREHIDKIKAEKKRIRRIWAKHYKKHGLKYRDIP